MRGTWAMFGVEQEAREYKRIVNPYFLRISERKTICPRCHEGTVWLPAPMSPNGAVERCPRCRWFRAYVAPESERVDEDYMRGVDPAEGFSVL